jgi:hypothetical protein
VGARGATVPPETLARPRNHGEAVIVRLAGARVITLTQAVDAACRSFLRDGTLDLSEVAVALAVSRATLYRVVGSRDRLLSEVLWRLAQKGIEEAKIRRTRDGIEGVLEVVGHFARHTLASRPLRRFIATEPHTATRVLASADGGVSQLSIAATVDLFREVGLTGRRHDGNGLLAPARLADDPARVAYLLVRIVESLCFAELAGTRPDVDLAEQTIHAMLVRACTPRQRNMARLLDTAMCLMWTSLPEALFTDVRLPLVLSGP